MLGRDSLILCAGTLAGVECGFAERIAAARAGGFDAISIYPSHYLQARETEGLSDRDMRLMLNDNGIEIADIDALLDWVPGVHYPYAGMQNTDWPESLFYRITEAVGARSINVVWPISNGPDTATFTESFAALCRRAAAHNLLVHLEGLPWSAIPSVEAASAIVMAANEPNGGLLFDAWHHYRLGFSDDTLLALPAGKYIEIQINDAPAAAEADVETEAALRRRIPGEGDIPLADILRLLDRHGVTAPIGVEVYSEALSHMSPAEIARRTGDAARRVIAAARS